MHWSGWSHFISMGGYGLYVWGSYGVTLVLLGGEVLILMKRNRDASKLVPESSKLETPGVVLAHRVFSAVTMCVGLLVLFNGLHPMNKEWSFIGGPAGVAVGLAYVILYGTALALKSRPWVYIYLTILIFAGGLIIWWPLCIWWFRKETRSYYGFAMTQN